MTPTEQRVAAIMAAPERARSLYEVGPETAMAQDALIDGIDVDDFARDLADEFGSVAYDIPWLRFSDQRASFRGWGCLFFPAWLLYRAVARPRGEPLLPRPGTLAHPRLTVRHIARVLDQGYWSEPD